MKNVKYCWEKLKTYHVNGWEDVILLYTSSPHIELGMHYNYKQYPKIYMEANDLE